MEVCVQSADGRVVRVLGLHLEYSDEENSEYRQTEMKALLEYMQKTKHAIWNWLLEMSASKENGTTQHWNGKLFAPTNRIVTPQQMMGWPIYWKRRISFARWIELTTPEMEMPLVQ